MTCPSSESNSGLDADDTETSPDAEGSGDFLSREPGSFGSGKAASRSCLGCFASLLGPIVHLAGPAALTLALPVRLIVLKSKSFR